MLLFPPLKKLSQETWQTFQGLMTVVRINLDSSLFDSLSRIFARYTVLPLTLYSFSIPISLTSDIMSFYPSSSSGPIFLLSFYLLTHFLKSVFYETFSWLFVHIYQRNSVEPILSLTLCYILYICILSLTHQSNYVIYVYFPHFIT